MSLLSQASLVVVPSGYKEDKVYSVKPTDGSGDLTFTRASDGTRVNSQGLVERVPWNLLLQSNTFNTTWTTSNASVTGGQTGYDGSSNAWLIQSSNINGRIDQSISNSGVQTLSVYAKAGNSNWIRLRLDYSGANSDVYFDLQNGVVGSSYNVITTKIEDVGSGWYRCSVVLNQSITVVRIYTTSGNNSAGGSGNSAYIQDAQLVEGSTAKPYFPTTDRQDVPRLDYSNGCPSLLLEPQRTNLALYSEQFDNAAWSKSGVTITANNTTSPDGTQNADLVTTSSTTDTLQQSFSVTSGTVYTFSGFIKSGSADTIGLVVFSSFPTSVGTYNLTNGTATSGAGSPVVSIQDYGNGWYRATLTATATSTGTANFYFSSASTNAVSTYYVWGAQIEAGSYPTSYIPTTSASVTRVADAASKTGISSLIGQTEGTLFVEVSALNGANEDRQISINDGTASNRVTMALLNNGTQIQFVVQSGGSVVMNTTQTITGLTTGVKIAYAYKVNDFAVYVNGSLLATDTNGAVPVSMSAFSFDAGNSGDKFFGKVSQALLFKTRLSNADLATLTTL